jgi:hypothetical protein
MAFKRKFRRRIAAVLEVTPGTDPGTGYTVLPINTGATNAMESQSISRAILDDDFGDFGAVVVGKRWMLTAQMEGKGAGATGGVINEPALSIPLQGCALVKANAVRITTGAITGTFQVGETVTTDTGTTTGTLLDVYTSGAGAVFWIIAEDHTLWDSGDVITGGTSGATATANADGVDALVYYPTSQESAMKTLTVHDYEDGRRKIGTYVRGNCSIATNVNAFTTFDFSLMGIYTAPTDTALIAGTVSCTTPPVNGATVALGSVTMTTIAVSALSLDMGRQVNPIDDLQASDGFSAIDIGNAAPVGSITSTVPALSDFNPYTYVANSTQFKLSWDTAGAVGERIRVCVPNAQLSGVTEGEANGISQYTLPFSAAKDCADAEYQFYVGFY